MSLLGELKSIWKKMIAGSQQITAGSSLFGNIRKIKKPNASKHYLEGPTKNLSHNVKKRPARCEDTISPDTFHLLCDSADILITWSVFEIFAEIYKVVNEHSPHAGTD